MRSENQGIETRDFSLTRELGLEFSNHVLELGLKMGLYPKKLSISQMKSKMAVRVPNRGMPRRQVRVPKRIIIIRDVSSVLESITWILIESQHLVSLSVYIAEREL